MEPRLLRPVPDPLGNYIRPGYQDYSTLEQMLVDGSSLGSGLVFNPVHRSRTGALVEEANRRDLETVLDSKSLELSSAGGFARAGVPQLPWASDKPHTPALLNGAEGARLIRGLLEEVQAHKYTAVLAPTHFLESGQDPWLQVDTDLVWRLRGELDIQNLKQVLIYYPVMVRATTLRDPETLLLIKAFLRNLPIDGIWLRIHPFGTSAGGPLALRRYLEVCRELHELGIPLVAEHSGSLGVALMAFGAVGGIESGVTISDTVNLDSVLKIQARVGRGFSPPPRVYLHTLGAFLDQHRASEFFEVRGAKHVFGCLDEWCCPKGWKDMQSRPREHFLRQRAAEVANIARMPESLRPGQYMEGFLRPASDRAVKAAEIEPVLLPVRKRLESWRGTLRAELESRSGHSFGLPATGRRLRRSA